jgi:hypothetical protein
LGEAGKSGGRDGVEGGGENVRPGGWSVEVIVAEQEQPKVDGWLSKEQMDGTSLYVEYD